MMNFQIAFSRMLFFLFALTIGSAWEGFANSGTWTTRAPMPTARGHIATAVVNGDLYVIGGQASTGPALATNEAYDAASNAWFTKTSMPTPRALQGTNGAVVNGIIYVIGGNNGGVCGNDNEAYDPATNQWTIRAAMPTARCHLAVVALNGLVYAIGGTNTSGSTSYTTVEVYDPSTNSWSTRAPMPTGRVAPAAEVVGGRIYVLGGFLSPSPTRVNTNEAYDPATNSWTVRAAMPTARSDFKAVAAGGLLYAVGGSNGTTTVAINEVYDSATNTWGPAAAMPAARCCMGGAAPNGLIHVAGGFNASGAALSTNEAFSIEWLRQFGTSGPDHARAVARDSTGIYIAGRVGGALPGRSSAGFDDAFVRKYDLGGTELWTRQFGSHDNDQALAIAADSSGIYVAGDTKGNLPGQSSAGGFDGFLRKYDSSGTELWTRQFGSPADDSDILGIAVDSTGVYVAGITLGALPGQTSSGSFDAFVRKYDLNGNELWTKQFGTPAEDAAVSLGTDSNGVYVSGYTMGALPGQNSAGQFDAYVRKYTVLGNEVWTQQFGTAGRDTGDGGLATDATGVYVAGFTNGLFPGQNSAGQSSAFVRKYDHNGMEIWTRQHFGTPTDDAPKGLAVNSTGVYVSGYTNGTLPGQSSAGGYDVFVHKYDLSGADIWTTQFGTAGDDFPSAVAVEPAGAAYVVGFANGTFSGQTSAGSYDAFAAKLSTSNTPAGSNVVVIPIDAATNTSPATLTFSSVTQSGTTSVTVAQTGQTPPSGFQLGNPPTLFDLTTSAVFSGPITVCINYTGLSYVNESALRLFHYEGGTWVDVTTSPVDTANNIICGTASSLSPFAVVEPLHVVTVGISGAPAGAILAGTGVSLNAVPSSGIAPFAFVWRKNGVAFATTTTISDQPALGNTIYAVTATDSVGVTSNPASVTVSVFDFAVATTPADRTMQRGASATYAVIVTLASGSAGAPASVVLGLSDTPADATVSGFPASLALGTSASSATFAVQSGSTSLGDFSFTVTATAAEGSRSASANLHIFDYSLALLADRTVLRNCSTAYEVNVSLAPGSTTIGLPGTLALSLSGAPSDATATLSGSMTFPQSTVSSTTTPVSIATGATSVGNFVLNVVGSTIGGSHSGSANLNIYDYSISLAANPLVLAQNQQGSYTVTVTATAGSATPGAVTLTVSGLPAGMTGMLTSALVTPTTAGSTTFLNIAPTVPAVTLPIGTPALTVTGSDGSSCTRAGSAQLIVIDAQTFSLMRDTNCNALVNGSDVIFTPAGGAIKLTATNPGGYMYNAGIQNTGSTANTTALTIDLPSNQDLGLLPAGSSAFALWGSNPVKVFSGNPCSSGATDITPAGITVTTTSGTVSQPFSTNSTFATGPIVIPAISISAGGAVWVEVHTRYGLLGTTNWPSGSQTSFVRGYQFKARFAFGSQTLTNATETSFSQVGKRFTGIGGYALAVNGAGKGGLAVVVAGTGTSCTAPSTTTQNVTGFYSAALPANTSSTVNLYNAACTQVIQSQFPTVAEDQFVQVDFTNLSPADPVIEGIVGTAAGGIEGIILELSNASQRLISSTTTNSGGYYSFRFSAPGPYTVTIKPPAGYTASVPSRDVFLKQFDEVRLDFTLSR